FRWGTTWSSVRLAFSSLKVSRLLPPAPPPVCPSDVRPKPSSRARGRFTTVAPAPVSISTRTGRPAQHTAGDKVAGAVASQRNLSVAFGLEKLRQGHCGDLSVGLWG